MRKPSPLRNSQVGEEPSTLSLEALLPFLRQDLATFAAQAFQHLHPSDTFLPNWHHYVMASKLEACIRGDCRRLIINLPPRHLKSLYASIALPAFWHGRDPGAEIVCASYAQGLADELAQACRKVMGARWYAETFPGTVISSKKDAVSEFKTTAGGFRFATSVGGILTGRGGDIIIVDDPLKPIEASSRTQRTKVNDWFDKTLYSRLNRQRDGVIIIVMQRLHMDDLVGHVREREEWEVLSLPAIAKEEERYTIQAFGRSRIYIRRKGELLHEALQDQAAIDRLRENLLPDEFEAQYQQDPMPPEGAMVKSAWWQAYQGDPGPFERIIQSWDTANTSSELSDYSVCTTWGMKKRQLYLLDVFRARLDYPDLKKAVKDLSIRYRANLVLIENKASGTSLIQDLGRDGVNGILGRTPEDDKQMRLYTHLTWIKNGDVLLPESAPWLREYLREMGTFPNGDHDDQVDSTSQVLAWAKTGVEAFHGLRLGGRRSIHEALDSYVHGGRVFY